MQSDNQYKNLFDNIPIGIIRTTLDGSILAANHKIVELSGFDSSEQLINTVKDIGYDFYYSHGLRQEVLNVLKKNGSHETNLRIKTRNGMEKVVKIKAIATFNSSGEIEYIDSIVEDLSEKHAMEQNLKQRDELFKSVLELAPYSIVINDLDGKYTYVNKAFSELSGYSLDEVLGKTGKEVGIVLEDEADKDILAKIIANGEVKDKEVIAYDRNGKTLYTVFSSKVVRIDERPFIISATIDITARKLAELELIRHKDNLELLVKERTLEIETLNEELIASNEELHQHNEELFLLNENLASQKVQLQDALANLKMAQNQLVQSEKMASIGVLTAGVAHEINNPVNFISGGVTGLEIVLNKIIKLIQDSTVFCEDIPGCKSRDLIENSDYSKAVNKHIGDILQLIASIRNGVERTTSIIRSLRTFSRLDSELKTESNIHELIESSLVLLSNKYKNRITIEREFLLQENIWCYPGKLSQVFLNLLNNAIQAIEGTGTIKITTQKKQKNAEIRISDTGIGIPLDIQARVFDPFFTTKPVGEGTGMGLSIVHGIIIDHGGDITFKSKPGKGTEFIIVLPER